MALQRIRDRLRALKHLLTAFGPRVIHRVEYLCERGSALHGTRRVIGTRMKSLAFRREEHGHGPATLLSQQLGCGHVQRIDIGALLAVHLDGHKVLVDVLPTAGSSKDSCAIT